MCNLGAKSLCAAFAGEPNCTANQVSVGDEVGSLKFAPCHLESEVHLSYRERTGCKSLSERTVTAFVRVSRSN